MATYNRSNVIGFAIRALLRSTFTDWELIVVGDACTDDTREVVASFADDRIRYIGLAENFGEQTGPNNVGVQAARGEFLAFLNHDDMWLPDHLAHSLAVLQAEGADLVFGQGLCVNNVGAAHVLAGALTGSRQVYQPWMTVPATLWVMRRALCERVGAWKPSWELRSVPSQEWLYRAHREGARLIAEPRLSALIIQSGDRLNSYKDRQQDEHVQWSARMQASDFPATELARVAGALCNVIEPGKALSIFFKALSRQLLHRCGIWPPFPRYWQMFWRKGAFLRQLRRQRGLAPVSPAALHRRPERKV